MPFLGIRSVFKIRTLLTALALVALSGSTRGTPAVHPSNSLSPALPGQTLWNDGVSSYLFGTNNTEEWHPDNFLTDPHNIIQPSLQSARFSIMRSFVFHYSL